MKSADFLKLIGATWEAFHDHPDADTAACLAQIRSVGGIHDTTGVCQVTGCNWDEFDTAPNGSSQRARRDLIVQAPRMYQYIASMAETGDTEAKMILRQIHGDAS